MRCIDGMKEEGGFRCVNGFGERDALLVWNSIALGILSRMEIRDDDDSGGTLPGGLPWATGS